jgi:hypothetical protein
MSALRKTLRKFEMRPADSFTDRSFSIFLNKSPGLSRVCGRLRTPASVGKGTSFQLLILTRFPPDPIGQCEQSQLRIPWSLARKAPLARGDNRMFINM